MGNVAVDIRCVKVFQRVVERITNLGLKTRVGVIWDGFGEVVAAKRREPSRERVDTSKYQEYLTITDLVCKKRSSRLISCSFCSFSRASPTSSSLRKPVD
jgi:hypothetical protein